jgi:hypothetical protein
MRLHLAWCLCQNAVNHCSTRRIFSANSTSTEASIPALEVPLQLAKFEVLVNMNLFRKCLAAKFLSRQNTMSRQLRSRNQAREDQKVCSFFFFRINFSVEFDFLLITQSVVTVKVARSPMATLAPIRVSGPFSASRFVNNWLPPSEALAVESAPSSTEIPIDYSIADSIAASSAAKRKSRLLVKQIMKPKAVVPKPRIVSNPRVVSRPKVPSQNMVNPTSAQVPADQTVAVSDQPTMVPQTPEVPLDIPAVEEHVPIADPLAANVPAPVEPGSPPVVTKPKPKRVANVVAPTVPFRIKRTKKAVVKPVVARVRKVRERAKLPPRRGVGKPARPPVLVRWPRKPRQAPVVRSDLVR